MKKRLIVAAALTGLLFLTACAKQTVSQPEQNLPQQDLPGKNGVTMLCTIVDGAQSGDLLLARQDASAYDVYRLQAAQIPVTVDGVTASAENLTDGMTVEVTFSGNIAETFPAQLGEVTALDARTPNQGGYTDLCGLYLQVLNDLWKTDAGLNSDITIAGVDLSTAPGELTPAEKAAIIWRFGEEHGVATVTGTFDELAAQGYVDKEHLQWEDGCLFSITENHSHDAEQFSLPTLHFDAEKWRSGTGAYYFMDCSCLWTENGSWSTYQVGSEAIS